jgi:hypothetical protein
VNTIPAALADPTTRTPARQPNSLRRTSHIDISFDESGSDTALWLHGRARDLFTDEHTRPHAVAEADITAGLDEAHHLLSLTTTPPEPRLDSLHGLVVRGGFRAALRERLGASATTRTPLYLLLDDLPVAALISGYARLYQSGLDETEPPRRRNDGILRADICSGWHHDGTMMVALRTEGRVPATVGPAAPALGNPADPHGWHHLGDVPAGAMRRRRLVEVVWGDPLAVHAMFRDSHKGPDGVETVLHEYTVAATVDPHTRTVLGCEATPRALPWPECPAAAASAARLSGQPVAGLRDYVRQEFTGTTTCTHLNDLLRSLADVASLTDVLRARATG